MRFLIIRESYQPQLISAMHSHGYTSSQPLNNTRNPLQSSQEKLLSSRVRSHARESTSWNKQAQLIMDATIQESSPSVERVRGAAIPFILGAGDAAFPGHRGGARDRLLSGHTAYLHDHRRRRGSQHACQRPQFLFRKEPCQHAAALWHRCSAVHAPFLQTCVITCVNMAISGKAVLDLWC